MRVRDKIIDSAILSHPLPITKVGDCKRIELVVHIALSCAQREQIFAFFALVRRVKVDKCMVADFVFVEREN